MKFLIINGKFQKDANGNLITVPDNYDNEPLTLNGKLLKTSAGLVGNKYKPLPTQVTPAISLVSGSTIQMDTIDEHATTIEVYADGTKIGEVAKS